MAVNHGLVDSIAKGTGMTYKKAARIAAAIAEQGVERHELESTENNLSCSVKELSGKIDGLASMLRAEAEVHFWKQTAGLAIVAIACSGIIIAALSHILG